jgi:hypothetical protein
MMANISQTAKYVRSKNAGPFKITVDIFCGTEENFEKMRASKTVTAETVANIYGVPASSVQQFFLPNLWVVKFSFPRIKPQGDRYENDMHGGQQYIRMLDLEV